MENLGEKDISQILLGTKAHCQWCGYFNKLLKLVINYKIK